MRQIILFFAILFFAVDVSFAIPGKANELGGKSVVSVSEEGGILTIQNPFNEITIDLEKGTWSGKNKRTGVVVFKDARYCVDHVGYWQWKEPETDISWSSEKTETEFGEGTQVQVVFEPRKSYDPIRILSLTLYPDQTFFEIGWGIKNPFTYPVRIKQVEPIFEGKLFANQDITETRILKSGSGSERNLIENTWKVKAYNAVMLTYKNKDKRQTMVVGGLSYKEFGRYVEFDENKKFKYMKLRFWDPQGKTVQAGKTYMSSDNVYMDFANEDPFESLENYGLALRQANNANPNVYNFPTLCGWMVSKKGLGEGRPINNSVGLVDQMDQAVKCGLLNYTPLAIRLEPDFYCYGYQGDTQQGWWDDEHWQKFGPNGMRAVPDSVVGTGVGSLRAPYDTFEKFCTALKKRGGITFTYFQTNMPSHDFAMAHPDWMINDDISLLHVDHRHSLPPVKYDYTNPGFKAYCLNMWQRLRHDGMKGIKFDYPETAWLPHGGFEDKTYTTTSVYREAFALCREGLGENAFIHERILGAPRQDITVGIVDLQRVWGDASHFEPEMASRIGLRWYKNRSAFLYYPDGKSFYNKKGEELPVYKRRAFLTLIAFISGRLEIGTSFNKMTKEMLHDMTRVFPIFGGVKSPRPVDMMVDGKKHPEVYVYEVNKDWNQVLFVNNNKEKTKTISAPLSGDQLSKGSLGLNPHKLYHIFDFWSQKYLGKYEGTANLKIKLRGGEVAMVSVRNVLEYPQILSTNRHIMQGMMDTHDVKWNASEMTLTGKVDVVKDETFVLTIACNGEIVKSVSGAKMRKRKDGSSLIDLEFKSGVNEQKSFEIKFR